MTADCSRSCWDLNALFETLSHRRRRLLLSCLHEHRRSSLADLAELVAEAESNARIEELSAERVRDVYLSLYHRHLPRLQDADLVEYDQERDVVVADDGLDDALRAGRRVLCRIEDDGAVSGIE
jgi:DNA-binding transcriptional ArsR family regulator